MKLKPYRFKGDYLFLKPPEELPVNVFYFFLQSYADRESARNCSRLYLRYGDKTVDLDLPKTCTLHTAFQKTMQELNLLPLALLLAINNPAIRPVLLEML